MRLAWASEVFSRAARGSSGVSFLSGSADSQAFGLSVDYESDVEGMWTDHVLRNHRSPLDSTLHLSGERQM